MYFLEISRARSQRRGRQTDNTLADRSYDFGFRTPEYQRRENADAAGRVKGEIRILNIHPIPVIHILYAIFLM